MKLSALPPAGRFAVSILREGLGRPALKGCPGRPGQEEELVAWLSFCGLCGAYLKAARGLGLVKRHSRATVAALEAISAGTYARNMVLFSEFARLSKALGGKGIALLPLKGFPALVALHRGDLSARQMADLDVLVPEGRMDEAVAVLSTLGYVESGWPAGEFLGAHSRHAFPRYHPGLRSAVEIHRRADYSFLGMGASVMPDFFERAREIRVDGAAALVPSWDCWLFQWAVHVVFHDCWAGKIRDLYDAALLLDGRGGAIPWEAVADPSRTLYLLRPLWMALKAASALFGPEPPEEWGRRLESLAAQDWPLREGPEWIQRKSLLEAELFRKLPLSVMSALNLAAVLPGSIPRFLREFLRIFLAPPSGAIEEQYGRDPGKTPRTLLVATRSAHVALTLADRILGKMTGRRRGF